MLSFSPAGLYHLLSYCCYTCVYQGYSSLDLLDRVGEPISSRAQGWLYIPNAMRIKGHLGIAFRQQVPSLTEVPVANVHFPTGAPELHHQPSLLHILRGYGMT